MLILTRKIDEKILIGHDIEVSILNISGRQVRVGINAPENISVHREEIYKKIYKCDSKKETKSANDPVIANWVKP